MPQILMPYTVRLDHTLRVTPLNTLFAKGDSAAHRFELTILRAGVQDDLTGCTVMCKFYRMADSTVVSVPGTVEGGKAVVALPAACYDYIGRFVLNIAIKKGEDETTVFYGDGYMHGQRADTAISGEYIIYDINTLLEKIAEIDAATQAANTATSNANTATANANTASDAANTAASTANTAATNANTAKDAANAASAKIDNMTVSATPASTGTATAELSTVDGHYHLALGLPKGNTGATPRISVQVQTGAAGSEASVSISGTAEEPVIHLTIPRGDPGRDGTGAGTVTAVKVAGETHAPDDTGVVDLGQITGGADLSDDAPAALGTAAAGASGLAARADHIHPMPTAAQVGAATAEEVSQLKADLADKLGKTETAADSAKLGGKAPEYYIQPRNLLDNSDFRNPVNQRGQTGYSGAVYTIDRWILWSTNSNATLSTDGKIVAINPNGDNKVALTQRFPKGHLSEEKSYTFAYLDTQGTIHIDNNPVKNVLEDFDYVEIKRDAWTGIIWAALYEGTYTADTLPPYVPKGYAAELAECQRYHVPTIATWLTGFFKLGQGIVVEIPAARNIRSEAPTVMLKNPKIYTDSGWSDLRFAGVNVNRGYAVNVIFESATSLSYGHAYLINGIEAINSDL